MRESGAAADRDAALGSKHSQHRIMYEMRTVDNRGVFIPPFFDIPLHNRNLFIHLKNTQKGHFLIGGKKGRGSSTTWALCVNVPDKHKYKVRPFQKLSS